MEGTADRETVRRGTWILAVTVLAVVAAFGISALVFDTNDGPIIGAGTSEAPAGLSEAEQAILATDGEDLFLVSLDGRRGPTLIEGDPEDERSLVSFAIRPDGTTSDLDAVVVFGGTGGSPFWHLRVREGRSTMTELPDDHQPRRASADMPPRPAFSPDGRHLAWVESSRGEASGPTLRTMEWIDDGPVSADGVDGDVSSVLDGLPNQAYRAEDWVWIDPDYTIFLDESDDSGPWSPPPGPSATGRLVLRAVDAMETHTLRVTRNAAGELAVSGRAFTTKEPEVDRAEVGGLPRLPYAVVYVLKPVDKTFDGPASQRRNHELQQELNDAVGALWTVDEHNEDVVSVGMPVNLGHTDDPGRAWMDVAPGGLLLAGHGTTAALFHLNRHQESVETMSEAREVYDQMVTELPSMTFGALLPPG